MIIALFIFQFYRIIIFDVPSSNSDNIDTSANPPILLNLIFIQHRDTDWWGRLWLFILCNGVELS